MSGTVLRLSGIEKGYPGLKALGGVDFELAAGEVRALMGKNGAGKSTLVRIISGAERPDAGTVALRGATVAFRGPSEALRAGIATVHQELTVVPGLSVAENILLGRWPAHAGTIDRKGMASEAGAALQRLGRPIDLWQEAGSLSIAQQQLVEIARALSHHPSVLILDEPTSSLPGHEVDALLATVRRLADGGVAVIYVSHRMDEIAKVADSITVLRDGWIVSNLPAVDAPPERIATLMMGEDLRSRRNRAPVEPSAVVALSAQGLRTERLLGADLQVQAGEIVGIAGLLGAGRTELLRCLAGVDRRLAGRIEFFGQALPRVGGVAAAIVAGAALVPEDRKKDGLVLDRPVAENLVLSCLNRVSRFGVLQPARERGMARASRDATSIKAADLTAPVATLSGGNQQKIVLARCINSGARILLLDEPTRGVDVHAKSQIYAIIEAFAARGGAVVMVSSEYEELLTLCHRVLIIREGRIVEGLDPAEFNLPSLMSRLLDAPGRAEHAA